MEPAPAPPDPLLTPPPPTDARRRWRVIATAVGLASLLVICDAMIGGPLARRGLPHSLGGLALLIGGLVALSGILTAFRSAWHRNLRRDTDRAATTLTEWTRRWFRGNRPGVSGAPMRLGERIALISGLVLTALDVMLTALLLKDVFPEPPYRLELLSALHPAAAEWSFYLIVAGFKALLELWFGVVDRMKLDGDGRRTSGWAVTRWFVLGGASAFDAVLAASRGLLLAEQGLDGAAITVSNIVFIGFGIAVPWVAALTGGLLVPALEPILSRLAPLKLLDSVLRLAVAAVVWLVALAFGLPFLASLAVLGILTATWFAIENGIGVVMGHEPDPPPELPWASGIPEAELSPHPDVRRVPAPEAP